jgi:ribosomal protein S18 acetylase RimI-like enzyme
MTLPVPIDCRAARIEDVEAIALLHAESWRRTYRGMMTDEFLDGSAHDNRRLVWRKRLAIPSSNQYVCVAAQSGSIVGFVCAFASEDPVWGSYIDNLHVVSQLHRRGVGRSLMRAAAEWLCDRAPERAVYLWVMEKNARARAFYDRLGGSNAGIVEKVDPGGGRAPNCRYVWPSPRELLVRCQ